MRSCALLISFIFCFCSLASSTQASQTTLDGPLVSPGATQIAPADWIIDLHNGDTTNWRVLYSLDTQRFRLSLPEHFSSLKIRLEQLTKNTTIPKGAQRAAHEGFNLLELMQETGDASSQTKQSAYLQLREVLAAFNYNFLYPLNTDIYDAFAGFWLFGKLTNQIAEQPTGPAENEVVGNAEPLDSTFWKNPGNISSRQAGPGFSRRNIPRFPHHCTYLEAKTSYGTHGGFTLECEGKKWKAKFGDEARSEPFNARIIWLLGFHATPLDYVEGLKVNYDRRIISEYNSRKELSIRIRSLFGFTWAKLPFQKELDPFNDAIQGATLKDGTLLNAADLRARLVGDHSIEELKNQGTYDLAFENEIETIVLKAASVESDVPGEKSIGAWSWNDFDHPSRVEYRAFGVLTAWLGIYDIRRDNNRLRLYEGPDGRRELRHYMSDVGSLLGCTYGVFCTTINKLDAFSEEMIVLRESPQGGEVLPLNQLPVRFPSYTTFEYSEPFANMSMHDIRWMARKIGQITRLQIEEALRASGFSAQEMHIYGQKLIARRNNLISTMGLSQEIPLL